MTAYEMNDATASQQRRFNLVAWLGTLVLAWRKNAHRRRAIHDLSALDERLLRDIGIDWEDVHDGILGRRRSILLHPLPRDRAKDRD